MIKTYIGLSIDKSASMRGITNAAKNDYNSKIDSIKESTNKHQQDTVVSVVECGYGRTSGIKRVIVNSSVNSLEHIKDYHADGSGTPLFDSVGDLIEQFKSVPDYNNENVSFLVMAITDGHENSSRKWNSRIISEEIRRLIATDKWTFIFRVPVGGSRNLINMGIPAGNILEWDQTNEGTLRASRVDNEAFQNYFSLRSSGARSTDKFYVDLSNVSSKDIEVSLDDISNQITIWPVTTKEDGVQIRDFIESRLGRSMVKGAGFYQLEKKSSKQNYEIVQDYKKILVRDKTTQAIYYGNAARKVLGLPMYGDMKLYAGSSSNFDVFVQSTSVNRKLKGGTSLIYWEGGTR